MQMAIFRDDLSVDPVMMQELAGNYQQVLSWRARQ